MSSASTLIDHSMVPSVLNPIQNCIMPSRRFRILQHLGTGACGAVYAVRSVDDKSSWAVKVFSEQFYYDKERSVYDKISTMPTLSGRIPASAHASGGITLEWSRRGCSNTHTLAICMQWLSGTSLDTVIGRYSHYHLDQLYLWLQITLDILHKDARVCHGDIRPENIIVNPKNYKKPWLIDFSHARTKGSVSEREWRRRKISDRAGLKAIFESAYIWTFPFDLFHEALADCSQARQTVLCILRTPDPWSPHQQRLMAQSLSSSPYCPQVHLLLQQNVKEMFPSLVMEIQSWLSEAHHNSGAIKLLGAYLSRDMKHIEISEHLELRIARARAYGLEGLPESEKMFQDLFAELGQRSDDTIFELLHARVEFAQYLQCHRSTATNSLTECFLIVDLLKTLHCTKDQGKSDVDQGSIIKDKVHGCWDKQPSLDKSLPPAFSREIREVLVLRVRQVIDMLWEKERLCFMEPSVQIQTESALEWLRTVRDQSDLQLKAEADDTRKQPEPVEQTKLQQIGEDSGLDGVGSLQTKKRKVEELDPNTVGTPSVKKVKVI
ncbi:hypothetical protein MMC30_006592 [Trapelia coarctata]|nr:hypothetical protein [Trapelia coarctata]